MAVIALALYPLPRIFVGPDDELTAAEHLKAENDVRATLIQALGGAVLLFGLYYTGRTYLLNREGQITERLHRAVDQLGDENLDVRLGGIYALRRIADESKRDHWPIVEVLTVFVRRHAHWKGRTGGSAPVDRTLATDVQAVLTVLGGRNRDHESKDQVLDLSGTDLRCANLTNAHLERANLNGAHLERANLNGAHLEGANLVEAFLEGAEFTKAQLGANLARAHMNGVSPI